MLDQPGQVPLDLGQIAPAERNLPLLLGMIGVWNTNFLGCGALAFTSSSVVIASDASRSVGSPLRIQRGQNALWTKGGLQYAPPIR